jgi:tetratricopeptide (TPR) repeat protein
VVGVQLLRGGEYLIHPLLAVDRVLPSMEFVLRGEWRQASAAFVQQGNAEGAVNPVPFCNAAYADLQRKLYRKALANAEKALKTDPVYIQAYILAAKALVGMNKSKQAREKLSNGLEKVASAPSGSRIEAKVVLEAQTLLAALLAPDGSNKSTHKSITKPVAVAAPSAAPPAAPAAPPPTAGPPPTAVPPPTALPVSVSAKAPEPASGKKRKPKITIKAVNAPPALSAEEGPVTTTLTQAHLAVAAKNLTNGTGIKQIDETIALGFLRVNTGKFADAIKIFDQVLAIKSDIYAARLGRGSAHALVGDFKNALVDFSFAVKTSPNEPDGYKRLGQVLGAIGRVDEAAKALGKAMALAPDDADSVQQRATIYHKSCNYTRALADFRAAIHLTTHARIDQRGNGAKSTQSLPVLWNYVGLCENSLGNNMAAVKAYKQALKEDPTFKEAWVNMAQAYRDFGLANEASGAFGVALQKDKRFVPALHLRGLMRHGEGRLSLALQDFLDVLLVQPKHVECRLMSGIVLHGMGQFSEAIKHYTLLIKQKKPVNVHSVDNSVAALHMSGDDAPDPDEEEGKVAKFGCPSIWAWYQREMAVLFETGLLDQPLASFELGHMLDPRFKELLTKRAPPRALLTGKAIDGTSQVGHKYSPRYSPELPAVKLEEGNVIFCPTPLTNGNKRVKALLPRATALGAMMQLQSPGFLANRRQHLQCGFAILEMAQAIRDDWYAPNGATVEVSGLSSSKPYNVKHTFGWRDFYDIGVKWRQFSEPNDPVFWIDYMTKEAFEEGFGLQTPMVTGQLKVPRYYPYFDKAFAAIKQFVDEQCPLTDELRHRVYDAKTALELHSIMGRDFWVVSPCYRLSRGDDSHEYLEGTRLTIVAKAPEGVEFTTRMVSSATCFSVIHTFCLTHILTLLLSNRIAWASWPLQRL